MSSTPRIIIEEKIAARLAAHPEWAQELTGIVQLEIGGESGGNWFIDTTREKAICEGKSENPGCRIIMGNNDFVRLVQGELSAQLAFVTGKLRVQGDLSLALKLGKLLQA